MRKSSLKALNRFCLVFLPCQTELLRTGTVEISGLVLRIHISLARDDMLEGRMAFTTHHTSCVGSLKQLRPSYPSFRHLKVQRLLYRSSLSGAQLLQDSRALLLPLLL
jgi:hypothetical protein